MKIKSIFMMLGLSMLASTTVLAHPNHHDQRGYGHKAGHHPHSHQVRRGPPPHANHRHKAPPPPRYYASGPRHHYYGRGDRLPARYMSNRYYVNDWRSRHLHAPPRGHRWVEVDGRYVLAAVATGIIASVFLAN